MSIRRVEFVGRRRIVARRNQLGMILRLIARKAARRAAQPPTAFHPDKSSDIYRSAHAGHPWRALARTISISCSSVSEDLQTHRSSHWRQGRSFIALNAAQTLAAAPALFGSATVLRTARHRMTDLRSHFGGLLTGREM
jgi:hypothetical protein